MQVLKTHGSSLSRSRRYLVESEYSPSDGGIGVLLLRLQEQTSFECRELRIRLDPLIADEYVWIEPGSDAYFVVCGAQGVVVVDVLTASLLTSVAWHADEGETVGVPWCVEDAGGLIVATELRVWCLDDHGRVRWMWSCPQGPESVRITGSPSVRDGSVHVPMVRALGEEICLVLNIRDGLPTHR